MPLSVLDGFRCRRILDLARAADACAHRMSNLREPLCDRLHDVVSGETSKTLRRQLLALKRGVFNGRTAGASTEAAGDPGIRAKDPELQKDLESWQALESGYADIIADAERIIAFDLAQVHAHLAKLWKLDVIRTGILFAQPQLYRGIKQLLSTPGGKDRKLETSLLAYCYRAATKTSPFSTFTAVGIGSSNGDLQGELAKAFENPAVQTTLNASFVERIGEAVLNEPSFRSGLPVVVADLIDCRDGLVHFLAKASRTSETEDSDSMESVLTVPDTPAVRLVLDLVRQSETMTTVTELCSILAARTGVDAARASSIVGKLLDCGLLEPRLCYDANDKRAIAKAAEFLASHPAEPVRGSAGILRDIQPLVDALQTASPERGIGMLDDIKSSASTALGGLGGELPSQPEPVLVRHNVVAQSLVDPDMVTLETFRSALSRLASVLPLFDGELPYRERVREAFIRRYGADGECSSLLDLFRAVCEEAAAEVPPDPSGFREGAATSMARAAAELRSAFIRDLRSRMPASGTMEVPSSFWGEWREKARLFAAGALPLCVTIAGQLARDEDKGGTRFVVNKMLPGNGMPVAHYASDEGAPAQRWLSRSLRSWLPTLAPDSDVVELVGTFAFDGLIHPRMTQTRLVYPREPRNGAGSAIIGWDELAIRLDREDPSRLRLLRKSTGRSVVPIHLGTLGSIHLPPFYRFVKSFGPAFSPDWSPIDFFEAMVPPDSGEIRRYGRITHGPVVVARETWCFPSASVPRCSKGEDDFSYFRRLRAWAEAAGLPRQVYVTAMRTKDYLRSDVPALSFRRAHKPFYVDWDDFVSHRLFRRFAFLGQGVLTISEALPDRSACPFRLNGDAHNIEHMIELTAR